MQLTGAQIIIETLLERGTDTVFGYPGGFVLNIYDELYKSAGRLKSVTSCHEQGACHAADGYARATGKTGVVIATSGPGATNLVTGIATAYLDSTPLVAITGNVPQDLIGRDSFQEVDICGVTMPVTKHNFMVKTVESLADTLRTAFEIAESGRPGPVLVDVPKNIQAAVCEYAPKTPVPREPVHKNGVAAFQTAVEKLKNAKRPFIYAGGGAVISNASGALTAFAERIDAPVGASMMGLSALSADYDRFLGMTGMHGKYVANRVMAESDLLVAVGTRFSDRATGNKKAYCVGREVIHIDIDPAEIGKNIPACVSLLGDVEEMLIRLTDALPQADRKEWRERIEAEKKNPDAHLQMDKTRLTPQAVLECLNRHAEADTVVTTDVGQHQMWTAQYYKFRKPRTFITSGGLGTMGFGLGAAIGASMGTGRKAVHVTSDGSFHMNLNECATAVSCNLPVFTVVLNNEALGMVRQWQTLFYEKRYAATSLERKTDYVKLAEAFGMRAVRVTELAELEAAVAAGMQSATPFLLEVLIHPDEKVLPMIPPGGSIQDIILKG